MKGSIKKIRGFTLIELLVVVAIISLISSVVLASLNGARESARDSQRREDIRQLQTALELFYNENGHYPDHADLDGWVANDEPEWDTLENLLGQYMSTDSLPVPPGGGINGVDVYHYRKDGASYGDPGCHITDGPQSYLLLFESEVTDFDLPILNPNKGGVGLVEYCVVSI